MTEITVTRQVATPTGASLASDHPLLVYDGACGLCSRAVQFVLRHDRRETFRFLAAQSVQGEALYRQLGLDATHLTTFIVILEGRARLKSDGVLALVRQLGLPWSLLGIFRVVPRVLRDALYDGVARRRLQWFGSADSCALQDPRHAHRFVS